MIDSERPARWAQTWVFGDDLNTDVLHPPQFYSLDRDLVRAGLFHGVDPELQARVRPGDLVVGGKNFGCGSSRETSILSLKLNGVAAIVAVDFARIFFRSATNQGLPCFELVAAGDVAKFAHGGTARLSLGEATIELAGGERVALKKPNELVRRIWAAGGLLGLLP